MNSFIRGAIIANSDPGVEKYAVCRGKRVVGVYETAFRAFEVVEG